MKKNKHCENEDLKQLLTKEIGKIVTVYMTYENNTQWNAKVFKGVIESANCTAFVLADPMTGIRYVLLYSTLDYLTCDEPILPNEEA